MSGEHVERGGRVGGGGLARDGEQQAIAARLVCERGKQRSRRLVDAVGVVDGDEQRVAPADAQEPLRERRLHRESRGLGIRIVAQG